MESIKGMQDFDASPDVLVCIAHDPTLLKVLPFLNDRSEEDLNDWKSRGFKEQLLWGWLNDLPRYGRPGRPMLVDGAWRENERVTDFLDLKPTVQYSASQWVGVQASPRLEVRRSQMSDQSL